MNAFMREFSSSQFEVLAFPCNNFHLQEPGDGYAEILNGIKYVRPGGGYEPMFQMFKKIDVNGKNEHPLYTYLKSRCGPTRDEFDTDDGLYYDPLRVSDVRWNFEIFLISRTGVPIYRYSPDAPLDGIGADIRKLIQPSEISSNGPKETEALRQISVVAPVVEPAEIPFHDTAVEPEEEEEEPVNKKQVEHVHEVYEPVSEEVMQEAEEESNSIYPGQSPIF